MRAIPTFLLVAALTPAVAAAHEVDAYGHHMDGYGWGGMIFGPLFMILLLVAAVVAVILVLRWMGVLPPAHKSGPLRTLEERFAKGEIDAAEFSERKKALLG